MQIFKSEANALNISFKYCNLMYLNIYKFKYALLDKSEANAFKYI